jgi:hypothetical protein
MGSQAAGFVPRPGGVAAGRAVVTCEAAVERLVAFVDPRRRVRLTRPGSGHSSWYGTSVRIVRSSKSKSRLMKSARWL